MRGHYRRPGDPQDHVSRLCRLCPATLGEVKARPVTKAGRAGTVRARGRCSTRDPWPVGLRPRRSAARPEHYPRATGTCPPTCSTRPARCASSRTCSISSNPPSGSAHARILLALEGCLGVPEVLSELQGAFRPVGTCRPPIGFADAPRQPRVRLCQLATGRERLEHGDSFASGPPRLLRPSRAPEDLGKPRSTSVLPRACRRAHDGTRAPPRGRLSPRRSGRSGSTRVNVARARRRAARAAARPRT